MFSFALAIILETLSCIPGELNPHSEVGFAPLNIVCIGLCVIDRYCPAL